MMTAAATAAASTFGAMMALSVSLMDTLLVSVNDPRKTALNLLGLQTSLNGTSEDQTDTTAGKTLGRMTLGRMTLGRMAALRNHE